jgi:hypothetical protein
LPAAITAIFSDDFTIAALKNLGIKSDIFIESIMDVSRSYMKLDYAPSDLALSFFTKARKSWLCLHGAWLTYLKVNFLNSTLNNQLWLTRKFRTRKGLMQLLLCSKTYAC